MDRNEKIAKALGWKFRETPGTDGEWYTGEKFMVPAFELDSTIESLETQALIRDRVRELWCRPKDGRYIDVRYHFVDVEKFEIRLSLCKYTSAVIKKRLKFSSVKLKSWSGTTETEAWEEALLWLSENGVE